MDKLKEVPSLTGEEVDSLQSRVSKKISRGVLTWLADNRTFVVASRMEVGQELLKDIVSIIDEKVLEIAKGNYSEELKAELKVAKELLTRMSNKINNYYKTVETVKSKARG